MSDDPYETFASQYAEMVYENPDKGKDHPNQGDIYRYPETGEEESIISDLLGIIIISNACDIELNKLDFIAYLPIFSVEVKLKEEDFTERWGSKAWNYWYKVFNQQEERSSYLPPHELILDGFGGFVDTQQLQTQLIADFEDSFLEPILCVKSPFRENISYKATYLFRRIPVTPPDKDIIKNWFEYSFFKR